METCFASVTGYGDVNVKYNLNTNDLDVYYTDDTGLRMRISLNQLSDGYKGTISLIADIAYRMAILNPQLLDQVLTETDGIVLIDEIDLHLHPAWQQRVISDLTNIFPKVQFIVTTHAPAVINSVQSENLIILKDSQILQMDNQVYGKDVKISAADLDIEFDLVNTLNLNCSSSPLIGERKSALDSLIAEIGNTAENELLPRCITILKEFHSETTSKTPYVGILTWYLQSTITALSKT